MKRLFFLWGSLLLCLSSCTTYGTFVEPTSEKRMESRWMSADSVSIRALASFWDVVFFVVGHHCPPGPLGKKCREEEAAFDANGANGNGNGANGSASGSSSSSSSNGYDSNSGSGGGSGGGGSGGGGGGGGGGSSSSATAEFPPGHLSSAGGRMLMIFAACVACSAAIASIVVGMRRSISVNQNHPLFGALKKRSILFQNMAPRARPNVSPSSHEEATNYQLV